MAPLVASSALALPPPTADDGASEALLGFQRRSVQVLLLLSLGRRYGPVAIGAVHPAAVPAVPVTAAGAGATAAREERVVPGDGGLLEAGPSWGVGRADLQAARRDRVLAVLAVTRAHGRAGPCLRAEVGLSQPTGTAADPPSVAGQRGRGFHVVSYTGPLSGGREGVVDGRHVPCTNRSQWRQ